MSGGDDRARNRQYREYLKGELEAAAIYSMLADAEEDAERASVFRGLMQAEMRHAARWAEKAGIDPSSLEPRKPGPKITLMKWATAVLGTSRVLPVLLWMEAREIGAYAADPEARDIARDERRHARLLRGLGSRGGPAIGRSRVLGRGGSLRAAVLGVNDGLVSNFSLVMGVAGGTDRAEFVLLAGVAGLVAGAFSMAAGEHVSMRSQRDIYEHEINKERIELQEWPEEEEQELERAT